MSEAREQYFEITPNSTMQQLEEYGEHFAHLQRGVLWWLGDLARYAEASWPDTWQQVFPEWISPGLVSRCAGVAKAYPNESDRNSLATWSQHMKVAGKPDRKELLQAIVDAGLTTDESRKPPPASGPRWLLAVDCDYWLTRNYESGNELSAGSDIAGWIHRTVERLKEKNLTDAVCCFDSRQSFRKDLTADWEDKYKGNRGPKKPEVINQLHVLRAKLEAAGLCCVDRDGFEGDDLMASYAAQFEGKVTLLVKDKDLRQCLGATCNMLTGVEWSQGAEIGEWVPEYEWLSATGHTEEKDLRPDQWAEYQTIWGDSVDNVKGAHGIGEKGAKTLMLEFGTLDAVIAAARAEDERISSRNRESLLKLAEHVDVMRQLVTLRTDLEIPSDTRV